MRSRSPFLLIVALGVLAAAAAPGAAQGEDALLYLAPLDPEDSYQNFTAVAPNATTPAAVVPNVVVVTEGEWTWIMTRVPTNWSVGAGTTFHVVLYFDGLERVVPIADPTIDPEGIGRLKVRVELLRQSMAEGVASGFTTIGPFAPTAPSGPVRVEVAVTTANALTWGSWPGEAPVFGIQVHLSGRMPPDDPALLLVDSVETPSSVTAPGFPVAAFIAWEEADRRVRECNRLLLLGQPCASPSTSGPQTNGRATPGLGLALPFGALMAWGSAVHAQRERRPDVAVAAKNVGPVSHVDEPVVGR